MNKRRVKTIVFGGDPGMIQPPRARESNTKKESTEDDVIKARRNKRKELDGYFRDVKELSGTTLVGLAKKKKKEDVLTRLGVAAPKQQTMPLRMALGIKAGREKRLKRAQEQAKQSGVINSSSMKPRSNEDREKKRNSFDTGKGDVGGLDGIGSKNGIMRLSKKKLSPKLFKGERRRK